jgi:hypothetical protein
VAEAGEVTLSEARDIMGVSRYKVARLIKDGALKKRRGVRDMRKWYVSRAEVETLAKRMARESGKAGGEGGGTRTA